MTCVSVSRCVLWMPWLLDKDSSSKLLVLENIKIYIVNQSFTLFNDFIQIYVSHFTHKVVLAISHTPAK